MNTKGTSLTPSENSENITIESDPRKDMSLEELCIKHGIDPKECYLSNYTVKIYIRTGKNWVRSKHNWINERMKVLMKKWGHSLKMAKEIASDNFDYYNGGKVDDDNDRYGD